MRSRVTLVNIRTLPQVDPVAREIYGAMRVVAKVAARRVSAWYKRYSYQPGAHLKVLSKAEAGDLEAVLQSLDLDKLVEPLYARLAKLYSVGADASGLEGYKYKSVNLDLITPDATAIAYARARAASLVGRQLLGGKVIDNPDAAWAVTPGIRADIRTEVETALKEGPTPEALARKIEGLGNFQYWRARMISRTELAFAYIAGQHDQAQRLGFHLKASILGSGHKQTDICDTNAAIGFISIKQPFPSGDQIPPYHPNGVCDVEYERIHKKGGLTLAEQDALRQTARDALGEMKKTGESFIPSTPGKVVQQEIVSTYGALKDIFAKARALTVEERLAASKEADSKLLNSGKAAQDALADYTNIGYEAINSGLRTGFRRTEKDEKVKERADLISRMIEGLHLKKDGLFYRGVHTLLGEKTKRLLNAYAQDSRKLARDPLLLVDKGFQSLTVRNKLARAFVYGAGEGNSQDVDPFRYVDSLRLRMLLRVAVPEQESVLSTDSFSAVPREQEFLLPAGRVMRVVRVHYTDVIYRVETKAGIKITMMENYQDFMSRTATTPLPSQVSEDGALEAMAEGGAVQQPLHRAGLTDIFAVEVRTPFVTVDAVVLPDVDATALIDGSGAVLENLKKLQWGLTSSAGAYTIMDRPSFEGL